MTIAEALEARGEAREKIAIAMAMLRKGLDKVLVAETTKLELSKVEELSETLIKQQ